MPYPFLSTVMLRMLCLIFHFLFFFWIAFPWDIHFTFLFYNSNSLLSSPRNLLSSPLTKQTIISCVTDDRTLCCLERKPKENHLVYITTFSYECFCMKTMHELSTHLISTLRIMHTSNLEFLSPAHLFC